MFRPACHMTHLAEFEYRRDSKIFALPAGHQWVCNASLPSWPSVLHMWQALRHPTIYLCVQCAKKSGLREPPMRNALEEINRAAKLAELLEYLIVNKGSIKTIHAGNLDHLLLMYWSLGFDLHKGILSVVRDKFYSGGFALLRPLVEAQLRAHLVVRNAKNDVARIKDDTYRVNFDTIGSEIDASFGFEGYTERFLLRAAPFLHSFTHSGLAQLVRHFNENDIGAHYEDEEIIEVVHVATTAIFFLSILVTKHLKFEEEWKRTGDLFEEWGRPH
jgi:hypothetical protein